MSQIKYLVRAFLLLILFSFVVIAVEKLSSTRFIAQKSAIIDYIEPNTASVVTVNSEGKNLFVANCKMCHRLNGTDNFNFEGVEKRGPWISRENLIAWIKNPSATFGKFEYTKQLVEQYNGRMMPSFPNLTDMQIEAILDYIKQSPTYSEGIPVITSN